MNKSARDENGLNKRERTILKFIQKEIDLKGYPPSVREICKAVK
jgi:repressor LexA